MSAFTETTLLKKLAELNSSQQSIQTLSLWLIHHRKHYAIIVKTWLREIQTVSEPKKLTYMYLANDVIQNSKKKGPEYGKEFGQILPTAFEYIGENCESEKLLASLGRMLNIWQERGVYDAKHIAELRARLNKDNETSHLEKNEKSTTPEPKPSKTKEKSEKSEKRKHDEGKTKTKKLRVSSENNKEKSTAASLTPQNGDSGHHSPFVAVGDPPEPEVLITSLLKIENSASSDAVVREKIAKLPPEISEIGYISKLEDKRSAQKLAAEVNEAVHLLSDYNSRLAAEMEERTKLATMLRDYYAEQKDLLQQAESRLEEYKKKQYKLTAVQREITDHLSNLPDLTQLPDVTGGLAPLPSAGDLFSLH